MFDPFNDFESAGYLRNTRADKDPRDIKRFEHDLFEANIDMALKYLEAPREVLINSVCHQNYRRKCLIYICP